MKISKLCYNKVKPIDIEALRRGEEVICPVCKKGIITTTFDYRTSHYFECNNCKVKINLD